MTDGRRSVARHADIGTSRAPPVSARTNYRAGTTPGSPWIRDAGPRWRHCGFAARWTAEEYFV